MVLNIRSETKLQLAAAIPSAMFMFERWNRLDLRRLLHLVRLVQSVQYPLALSGELLYAMTYISTYWGTHRIPFPGPGPAKHLHQAFIETARHIVVDRQDLSIWDYERPPCAKLVEDLPTWVPDFSPAAAQKGIRLPMRTAFHIWGDYFMGKHKNIRVSEDNHLIIQARPLDVISWSSCIFNDWNASSLCLHLFQYLQDIRGEGWLSIADRFYRTLVLDRIDHDYIECLTLQPSYQLYDSFISMIMETALQILIGLPTHTAPNWKTLDPAKRSPLYQQLWDFGLKSRPFRELLRNAYGRRFFVTERGRFGMTTVEDVNAVDNN
ncbi:hypothetical protein F4803DRAFT_47977 [Xylaria telfairii]|nr:hypothetical protein F4803DRAFT_47977 [Xylaria telfairii]